MKKNYSELFEKMHAAGKLAAKLLMNLHLLLSLV